MRRAEVEEQEERMLRRQREFRLAADIVSAAWMVFEEVEAVAVIGSVARPLWREVPRFHEFQSRRIAIWHECSDLDLAIWLHRLDGLGDLRRAMALALRRAFEGGVGISVVPDQLDVFLFEPGSDRHLGRLCHFAECPKGKLDCLTPGCGTTPFKKVVPGFVPSADLLAGVGDAVLYRRGEGVLRSALQLPHPVA